MIKTDIITALSSCDAAALQEIRAVADAKIQEARQALMAQAAALGLSCSDGTAKTRKPRRSKANGQDDDAGQRAPNAAAE